MAKPQSTFRRGLRLAQLGMAFGLLSLLCQLLVAKPLNLLLISQSQGPVVIALQLILANFPLLFATPLLVSGAALAIEVSPWRLAMIAQAFVLATLWGIASLSMGAETVFQALGLWIPQVIAAVIGVLLAGFGYEKVATLRRRADSPATPSTGGTPAPTSNAIPERTLHASPEALAPSAPPPIEVPSPVVAASAPAPVPAAPASPEVAANPARPADDVTAKPKNS